MGGFQLSTVLLPVLMIVAGAGDVMTMRIPNRLTITVALLFLPMAAGSGMPFAMMGEHLLCGVVLLLLGYVLAELGVIGGGDGKLLAAAGLWFGFPSTLVFLACTALAGGMIAVAVFVWVVFNNEVGERKSEVLTLIGSFKPNVPYGFALAAGAIMAMPSSWWMAGMSASPA